MKSKKDLVELYDSRGLIADALSMEPLSEEEYRAIFFDWVFGQREAHDMREAARAMLDIYAPGPGDRGAGAHPFIRLLVDAAEQTPEAPSRGARSARRKGLRPGTQ